MKSPRILLVGMHIPDNKFTRQLRQLGFEVIWFDGRPGRQFPRFCDAALIAKTQCSHEGLWSVKADYGTKQGKPVFIADHSFSTVRERVQEFMNSWKYKHGYSKTSLGVALAEAINQSTNATAAVNYQVKPISLETGAPRAAPDQQPQLKPVEAPVINELVNQEPEQAEQKGEETMGCVRSEEDREKIMRIVHQCTEAGMGVSETAEMLNAEGCRTKKDKPFKGHDIYKWRDQLLKERVLKKKPDVNSFRKYTDKERKRIRKAIRALGREGITDREELCRHLIKQGFKAPDGSTLKLVQVQAQALAAGVRKIGRGGRKPRMSRMQHQEAQVAAPIPVSEKDHTALAALVLESKDLSSEKKISILKELLS